MLVSGAQHGSVFVCVSKRPPCKSSSHSSPHTVAEFSFLWWELLRSPLSARFKCAVKTRTLPYESAWGCASLLCLVPVLVRVLPKRLLCKVYSNPSWHAVLYEGSACARRIRHFTPYKVVTTVSPVPAQPTRGYYRVADCVPMLNLTSLGLIV